MLHWSAGAGLAGATFGAGLWVAGLSAAMNNLPGIMSGAPAIDAAGVQGAVREAMILASVVGADIGPQLTPIGSLATLIWIHLLQERAVRIGARDYRIGLIITPPVLLAALAGLWATLALAGTPSRLARRIPPHGRRRAPAWPRPGAPIRRGL